MKLLDQVISLELAKQLKKLGIKQESLWYWNKYITSKPYLSGAKHYEDEFAIDGTYIQYSASAFTVAELGEILPEGFYSQKRENSWGCADADNHLGIANIYDCDNIYTEADVRAKMIIYIITELKCENIENQNFSSSFHQ